MCIRDRVVAGDPLALPDIAEFSAMADLLDKTPELARFADEQRIAEARLQLARSQDTPDMDWQVGVRRLQATEDFALIGSVSMPVSYTHLDVYKRQGWTSTSTVSWPAWACLLYTSRCV